MRLATIAAVLLFAVPSFALDRDKDGYFHTGDGIRTKKVAFINVKVYQIEHKMKELPADKSKQAVIASPWATYRNAISLAASAASMVLAAKRPRLRVTKIAGTSVWKSAVSSCAGVRSVLVAPPPALLSLNDDSYSALVRSGGGAGRN